MRKVAFGLALVLFLMMPMSVEAVSARSPGVQLQIVFDGTNATCLALINGTQATTYLEATIKLWHRNRCLQTWEVSGYCSVDFMETVKVVERNTYRLSADVAINGVMQPTVSISRTCE